MSNTPDPAAAAAARCAGLPAGMNYIQQGIVYYPHAASAIRVYNK
jgi:hypothetical protein